MRSTDSAAKTRFLRIARDPHIIAGVHRYCDGWCEHCAITERCLAFRCRREFRPGLNRSGPARALTPSEAIEFGRALAAVDRAPAVASQERLRIAVDAADDDALAAAALDYTTRSGRLAEDGSAAVRVGRCDVRPTPIEVVQRFRSGIYFKTTRALVGRALAGGGIIARYDDATCCAAQVLACATRSRSALAMLAGRREGPALIGLLDVVEHGLALRFPDAVASRRLVAEAPFRSTKGNPYGQECEI